MNKIIKFIALSTIMISTLVYTENKEQITIVNHYGSDLSIQFEWRDKNSPTHTKRLEDQTVEKNKTEVIKSPISSYKLLEIKAYITKGINAAMNSSQKAHGNTYFVLTRGSRYKNDAGEKRHHIIIKGYKDKAAYDAEVAAKNAAHETLKNQAAGKNLLFSQCLDNSLATCDDQTDLTTLHCPTGLPDLNGMCSNGTLVTCADGTTPTCDDYSDPVKNNSTAPAQSDTTKNNSSAPAQSDPVKNNSTAPAQSDTAKNNSSAPAQSTPTKPGTTVPNNNPSIPVATH